MSVHRLFGLTLSLGLKCRVLVLQRCSMRSPRFDRLVSQCPALQVTMPSLLHSDGHPQVKRY
jgi:hypothetical protein